MTASARIGRPDSSSLTSTVTLFARLGFRVTYARAVPGCARMTSCGPFPRIVSRTPRPSAAATDRTAAVAFVTENGSGPASGRERVGSVDTSCQVCLVMG